MSKTPLITLYTSTGTLSYHPRKRRLSSNVTDVNQDLLSKRRTTCAENVSSLNNHLHSTTDPSILPTDTSVNHAHHTELQWDDVECVADYCCLLCLFISEHTYVPYWQAYTVLEMNCIEQQSQQLLSLTDSGAPDRKMFGCLKEPNQADDMYACHYSTASRRLIQKAITRWTRISGANHLTDPEANEVTSIVSYFLELPAIDKYLYCWKAAGFTADPLGSSALWTLQIRLDLMLHGCFRVLMYK
ncbi:hypothetical protein Tco_0769991 [Tanacetum coccineum]|uniref:Uncharacterized protein n=1 Tax=Tanacetum coccineum TaxID=301880 RepID=A0ABQ4ZE95_9ASTR